MIYEHDGKQYIVVAIGSKNDAAEWIAFRLLDPDLDALASKGVDGIDSYRTSRGHVGSE